MHLHFERNANAKCDCAILSLSWMGKVPDELPEDEGWKLNRTNYYQEGWLATGNVRGIVGVTFTTSHCKKSVEYPVRTNYNLRGHRSEVILVKWNEPYQKLASCDSSGIIFVWIKYEGRWSIELINDRNTPVTHFAWSHDGRMALICYQDGFVLVGSVAGQRYWSSMLNLDSTITCGIWTPDDQQVYFGTSHGGLVVMDVHGAMVAQVPLSQAPVTSMAWSCEKFKMEEGDDAEAADHSNFVLAVCVATGHIYLMKCYDDVSPIQFNTELGGPLCMEWSNSKHLLAVAGVANHSDNNDYINMLKCYSDTGILLYSTMIPYAQSPVTALTWGHNDKRLFVATGGVVHIAWVSRRVASLQLLCRLKVASTLPLGESSVHSLPLPGRIKHLIVNLFAQTIRCCVPDSRGLREFVSRPPANGTRLHCTMIRHDDEHSSSGVCYTLYLEYLGGLVPLLKGKRTSKIRPEFVIFDPQVDGTDLLDPCACPKPPAIGSDTSDTEKEDGCGGSPRAQRRRRKRHKSPADHDDDLTYVDTLPEHARLVEVTSNIWGTKFKIHGLADCVPANLGQVTYKTSLLHLQPRQMSLVMTELRDDIPHAPDPSFNPNVFSEDEEEDRNPVQSFSSTHHPAGNGGAIPIAPMTPRNLRQPNQNRFLQSNENTFVRSTRFIERHRDRMSLNSNDVRRPLTIDERPNHSNEVPRCFNIDERPTTSTGIIVSEEKPKDDVKPSQAHIHNRNAQKPVQYYDKKPSIPLENDENISTYQQNIEAQVLRRETNIPTLARPESINIEDESPYFDFNLSDIISFCENYKTAEDKDDKFVSLMMDNSKTSHLTTNDKLNLYFPTEKEVKKKQTFVNHSSFVGVDKSEMEDCKLRVETHVRTRMAKPVTTNLQSPKNAVAPCSVFVENGAFSEVPTEYHQNMHRIKNNLDSKKCEKICVDSLRYIDEDSDNLIDRMRRSCSVGYLDSVDTGLVPCELALMMLKKDAPKRLVLVGGPKKKNKRDKHPPKTRTNLKNCGKSRSLDSSELLISNKDEDNKEDEKRQSEKEFVQSLELSMNSLKKKKIVFSANITKVKESKKEDLGVAASISSSDQCLIESVAEKEHLPAPCPRLPRSQPASPALGKKKRNAASSPIRKHILNSPLLRIRRMRSKAESSDDEVAFSGDEAFTNKSHYKDLETFQKAQLRQKLKRGKVSDGHANTPRIRELVMHNKAPMWNENSQVYQLDFGGRVTQESAKNFQIEFKGKQVMQFGRIDGNAYTLDFQYPFSVLQAFAVALANVTQRLK